VFLLLHPVSCGSDQILNSDELFQMTHWLPVAEVFPKTARQIGSMSVQNHRLENKTVAVGIPFAFALIAMLVSARSQHHTL